MKTLSDLGIGDALMTTVGRVWENSFRTGQLVNAALRIRMHFLVAGVFIHAPIAVYLLSKAGCSLVYATFIWAALAIGLAASLPLAVLSVVPRLRGRIEKLQRLDTATSLMRLSLLLLARWLLFNAFVAILIGSAVQFVQAFYVRRWAGKDCNLQALPDGSENSELMPLVKQQIPNAVFVCLQSQITIGIISLWGTTEKLADLGALSRLGALFAVLGPVLANIIQPRFARLRDSRTLTLRYWQVIGGFAAAGFLAVALAGFFPLPFVWILGHSYRSVSGDIAYMIGATALGNFYTIVWGMNAVRGWIHRLWVTIPITLLSQFILLWVLDLGDVRGAILFGSLPMIPCAAYLIYLGARGMRYFDSNSCAIS